MSYNDLDYELEYSQGSMIQEEDEFELTRRTIVCRRIW